MKPRTLIVIPTYNEKENIPVLIDKIFQQPLSYFSGDLHLLIVDDNSPDGTAEVVKTLQQTHSNIFLLQRENKQGLGRAYVAGFLWAIDHHYDCVIEMDADLSHDPAYLRDILEGLQTYDVVIGSRYVRGVNVINWPLSRLLISYFGNRYARWVTGMPINDATAGYVGYRIDVLKSIDLTRVSASGYSFQIEMKFRAWKQKFKILETPIIFYERIAGVSKMSTNIIREGLLLVWKLRIKALIGRL